MQWHTVRFVNDASGLRTAVLDDYQEVASSLADWTSLPGTVEFVTDHLTGDDLVARVAGCDVLVAMRERTPFPADVLARLPRLRLLVTTGKRNPSIDLRAAAERGVVVCGTTGLQTGVVELTWALILATARRLVAEDRGMRDGGWQATVGLGLAGRTLGLLGLGKLGERVGRIGRAFGMDVAAWSPNLTEERAGACGARLVGRNELFAGSDVVSIHLVLGERSRGTVGAPELRAMRSSAILVNTSRGPIVDEPALVRALAEGWIAGAGLDVFDQEPLPPDHPLLHEPRATLSPHLGYVTDDNYRVFYGDAVADIRAWLAGSPVRVLAAG
jgi:phosphoglycerate dehydrogenase-like enzyme